MASSPSSGEKACLRARKSERGGKERGKERGKETRRALRTNTNTMCVVVDLLRATARALSFFCSMATGEYWNGIMHDIMLNQDSSFSLLYFSSFLVSTRTGTRTGTGTGNQPHSQSRPRHPPTLLSAVRVALVLALARAGPRDVHHAKSGGGRTHSQL